MKCKCNQLNYVHPKIEIRSAGQSQRVLTKRKPPTRTNMIKIRLADNPKDIVIKFSDKETLIKSLREILGI